MSKVKILSNNVEFELIFKPIGKDILTIELDRITKNNQSINLITVFKEITEETFKFLDNNPYNKVGFLFSDINPKWIEICQWVISKKIEGEWILYRHPHSILVEKIS